MLLTGTQHSGPGTWAPPGPAPVLSAGSLLLTQVPWETTASSSQGPEGAAQALTAAGGEQIMRSPGFAGDKSRSFRGFFFFK